MAEMIEKYQGARISIGDAGLGTIEKSKDRIVIKKMSN